MEWIIYLYIIHVDILLLKTVMRYVKCKVENVAISNDLYFVEYYVGIQLARRFGFRVDNRTPHASQPNTFYNYVLAIIRTYNISVEELVAGSINKIYKRIIFSLNERNRKGKYYRILSSVLPSSTIF